MTFGWRIAPGARRAGRALLAGGLALGWLALAGAAPAAAQLLQETVRIDGRLRGAPPEARLEEARVSLVKFTLNEQGRPQREPVGEVRADAGGRYSFAKVAVQPRTLYRVTATLGHRSAGSRMFSIAAQQTSMTVDLTFPELVGDTSRLSIQEGVLVLDERRGALLVTEVVHFRNATDNIIDTSEAPLELTLPPQADHLEMLRPRSPERRHERLGETLLVFQNVPPGRSSVAFRYRLPVFWGGVTLDKRYSYAVGQVSVLTPSNTLRVSGARLKENPERTIDQVTYRIWSTDAIPKGGTVVISASGVPIRQQVLLVWAGVFLVLVVVLVAWFLRTRLAGAARPPSGSAP